MKKFVTICIALAALAVLAPPLRAQLPGPGNLDWVEVWTHFQPASPDAGPFSWMYGNRSYTGLAYDKWNDAVYVVNPATCTSGSQQTKCVRIWAIDAESGNIATRIENAQRKAPPGQIYVDPNVVTGSISDGQYSLFKIDLDDQGRIYAANIVAPLFGICYPGPPPNCDPAYLAQGPYKIYRWNSPSANPELLYKTAGSSPTNTTMTWTMWGTSFDVIGKEHIVNGRTVDSTRIYASGGKFYSGYIPVNNEINCFVADTSSAAPTPFQFASRMIDDTPGSAFAAHGIAATGPWPNSPIFSAGNSGIVELNPQVQQLGAPLRTLPSQVTGDAGSIAYFLDERFNGSYLIVADGLPSSTQFGDPNYNTRARVVDLNTTPAVNWPPTKTPAIGQTLFNNLTGEDNWITDVDYKIWINDNPSDSNYGNPHLQLFILMSNNGIASYRSRWPWGPVELSLFNASIVESAVSLTWTTAAETNNKGFDIERSFDRGKRWETIGFVPGKGTTTAATDYAFNDLLTSIHENAGIVKYRLRQIDFDGGYEYSPIVDVITSSSPGGVELARNYPNPFRESTDIGYRIAQPSYVALTVYNALGVEVARLVEETQPAGTHTVHFDATGLPAGTYMYQLNANGQISQKKMVLTK